MIIKTIEGNFDNPKVNELLVNHFKELRSVSPEGASSFTQGQKVEASGTGSSPHPAAGSARSLAATTSLGLALGLRSRSTCETIHT